MRNLLAAIPVAMLAGCGPQEPSPFEYGQWEVRTDIGPMRINGATYTGFDSQLPPDRKETKCGRPGALRTNTLERINDFMRSQSKLKGAECALEDISEANGTISGDGECKFADGRNPVTIKLSGNWAPRHYEIDAKISQSISQPDGQTHRATLTVYAIARRLGDCP